MKKSSTIFSNDCFNKTCKLFITFTTRIFTMIEAVIFDMDGLLIDSEPYWQESEKVIFGKLGVEINDELQQQTYGLGTNEVIHFWYHYKPWPVFNEKKLKQDIFDFVENRIRQNGKAMPGANEIIDFFRYRNIPIALASASPVNIIEAVLIKLNLREKIRIYHSAAEEEYSKPHPAVFLSTAKKMQVHPTKCLVFEDSLYGLIAAKAALMKTVVIPGRGQTHNPKYEIADIKLDSLSDFTEKHFEILNSLH